MSAAGDASPLGGLGSAFSDVTPSSHPRRGRAASPRESALHRRDNDDDIDMDSELDAISARIERALNPRRVV